MRVHPCRGENFRFLSRSQQRTDAQTEGFQGSMRRFFWKEEYSLYFVCKFFILAFYGSSCGRRYQGVQDFQPISGVCADRRNQRSADLGRGKYGRTQLFAAGFMIRLITVVILGFPIYRRGMIGAGDVKMAALFTAWLGVRDGLKA